MMACTINDNITIGTYQFPVNPGQFGVSYLKFQKRVRSIDGTLQTTHIGDGTGSGVLLKRTFTISGISYEMLSSILNEFSKNSELTFISPQDETFTVIFADYSYDMNEQNRFHPPYNIQLEEV